MATEINNLAENGITEQHMYLYATYADTVPIYVANGWRTCQWEDKDGLIWKG